MEPVPSNKSPKPVAANGASNESIRQRPVANTPNVHLYSCASMSQSPRDGRDPGPRFGGMRARIPVSMDEFFVAGACGGRSLGRGAKVVAGVQEFTDTMPDVRTARSLCLTREGG